MGPDWEPTIRSWSDANHQLTSTMELSSSSDYKLVAAFMAAASTKSSDNSNDASQRSESCRRKAWNREIGIEREFTQIYITSSVAFVVEHRCYQNMSLRGSTGCNVRFMRNWENVWWWRTSFLFRIRILRYENFIRRRMVITFYVWHFTLPYIIRQSCIFLTLSTSLSV